MAVVVKDKHDFSYYVKCMIGGALACGVTHAAMCPLDIIKCRMQVINPLSSQCSYFLRSTPDSTNLSLMPSEPSEPLKEMLVLLW